MLQTSPKFQVCTTKNLCCTGAKKCAPNELTGAAGTFGTAGKILDDPPAFLPWDRSYCCCDCYLQVRDSLGVVAIHPVLEVSPHIKIWGIKSGECDDHCGSHLRLISRSGKRCCSHANDSFEEWAVVPSCWNHWRTLTTPLRRPSGVQNLPRTWTYRSVLIVADRSLSSSNQNGPMIPCSEMATQAVHFTECNGFADSAQGVCYPRRCCFSSSRDLSTENVPRPKTRQCHESLSQRQSCRKTTGT